MRTPLYDEHIRLGAKMTEFAGWEMPLQYAGIAHEVEVVRNKVGLFDICHMGEFIISGANALDLIQYVTTNDVSTLAIGQAKYTLLCDENGGVIDDLIVYRTNSMEYLLIVNASNEKIDFEWITSHNISNAKVENISGDTSLIAVQGPMAEQLVQNLAEFDIKSLGKFHIASGKIAGINSRIARTGYTGEDGFEILCSASETQALWKALLELGKPLGVEPIGLGARDVLRLESAYPLHGHEHTRKTTPVAAHLMWVVKPEKGDFIGKDAILRAKETGNERLLVGLEAVDRCIPRHGCDVMNGDAVIGSITSGTFSPTIGKGIALAYVDREFRAVGGELSVVMGGRTCKCKVVPTPFYKR